MTEGIRFNSKIDLWLLVVLLLFAAVCLFPALRMLGAGTGIAMRAFAVLLLLIAALPVWLIAATHYVLTDTALEVRSGPFRWRVRLDEITAITPTRSPLSSPALSLDRLRIDYGRGRSIMISPEPRQAFLHQLQARLR